MKSPLLFLTLCAFGLAACQTTKTAKPDRFSQADANGDGFLSASETNNFVVRSIFESRDTDGDGKITREEWDPTKAPATMKTFRESDINRDDVITLDEAEAYASKRGIYKDIVREADKNGDGLVSREEAEAYYASKEG